MNAIIFFFCNQIPCAPEESNIETQSLQIIQTQVYVPSVLYILPTEGSVSDPLSKAYLN